MTAKKHKNLILITGDEAFLREKKKTEVLDDLGALGSINFNTFSGEQIDLDEVQRLAETMPLFEDLRKILIVDSALMGKGASDSRILDILEEIPETTVVIFEEEDVSASSQLYKLIKQKGEIYRFDSVDSMKGRSKMSGQQDVRDWARKYLADEGRRIDEKALGSLLELAGYEMMNLQTELEKLISYTLDRRQGYCISAADVKAICSATLSDRVFSMVDLKLRGDIAGALVILEELYALRVPALKILSILEKQYERAFAVKDGMRAGYTDAEIISRLELKDWQLRQIKKQAANISHQELKYRLEECIDMDLKIKTGDMTAMLAVELLVIG